MGEILLSELIEQTKESICSLEHSQSTLYQYNLAWRELTNYFNKNNQVLFSKHLAEQFVLEYKAKLKIGEAKKWRYKLIRLSVRMLIEVSNKGHFTWNYQKHDTPTHLHQSAFIFLQNDYLKNLNEEGKGAGTIQTYDTVSKQFLIYLEHKEIKGFSEVQLNDVSLFIPFISKQYQPSSMRTVLSALRAFLRFVERMNFTTICLSAAIPRSFGIKTNLVPIITSEEERKMIDSADCKTASGKRNYAMLLLALRTGLRSIDIVNLMLSDIKWKSNVIEIIQRKTGTPLVLPLLTDVGNAIADYILNGRPDSQQPYVFLRTQAPYKKLAGHSNCFAISRKIMKEAGIRQGIDDRKGFHCLRHYLASRLLSEEIPLPIISSILGHRDKDSTKVYLSTDFVHLRTCALSLKGIEVTKENLQ